MAFPAVTYLTDQNALAGLVSNASSAGLSTNNLSAVGALASVAANLLISDPSVITVPAGDVSHGTFGANIPDTGAYLFPGTLTIATNLLVGSISWQTTGGAAAYVEVSGVNPGVSVFQTTNSGSTTNEAFVIYGAYDASSLQRKTGSVSSKWANANSSAGISVLRINSTYMVAGVQTDDVAIRVFGNAGIALWGSSETTGPGTKILSVAGVVTTTKDATINTVTVGLGGGAVATNTALGNGALAATATGAANTGGGQNALASLLGGNNNTALGNSASFSNTAGNQNTAVGVNALYFGTSNSNTAVGFKAGVSNSSGSGCNHFGNFAGAYELGSNAFYVDNQDRTNTAGDKANALLYGIHAVAASNQTLRVNATLTGANSILCAASSAALAVVGFGVGYANAVGAGGTVTQLTGKTTAFTLNTATGQITFAGGALLGFGTASSATWTCSAMTSFDTVVFTHVSGGTPGTYNFSVTPSNGQGTVWITNVSSVSLSQSPVVNYCIIKGAQS